MKTYFTGSDFAEHIGKTFNRDLINHFPEIQLCRDFHKGFSKWYENKFTKYYERLDHEDVRVMVESLNICLPEINTHTNVVSLKEV